MYPIFPKIILCRDFCCLPKALLRAGAGRAGAQKSRGGLCVPVWLLVDFSRGLLVVLSVQAQISCAFSFLQSLVVVGLAGLFLAISQILWGRKKMVDGKKRAGCVPALFLCLVALDGDRDDLAIHRDKGLRVLEHGKEFLLILLGQTSKAIFTATADECCTRNDIIYFAVIK